MMKLLLCLTSRQSLARSFSWKSRLGKDPELRRLKQESLNKRYAFRRFGELENSQSDDKADTNWVSSLRESVLVRYTEAFVTIKQLANISSLRREDVLESSVSDSIALKQLALSVSLPNPRTAIVVVKDRGNTERVLKSLKRSFPNWIVTLMDRERVEIKLPKLTEGLRVSRGQGIGRRVDELKKDLKRSELRAYERIRKSCLSPQDATILKEQVKAMFGDIESQLNVLSKDLIDSLGLE